MLNEAGVKLQTFYDNTKAGPSSVVLSARSRAPERPCSIATWKSSTGLRKNGGEFTPNHETVFSYLEYEEDTDQLQSFHLATLIADQATQFLSAFAANLISPLCGTVRVQHQNDLHELFAGAFTGTSSPSRIEREEIRTSETHCGCMTTMLAA